MTPACQTCGYVVEWVRTLYAAKWRLFRGQPAVYTHGRYWEAPPGTPDYPFEHNLGSADWVADHENPPPPPTLGEDPTQGRSYRKSPFPGNLPPPIAVGERDCVSGGSLWPVPVIAEGSYQGFRKRCWTDDGRSPPVAPETNMFKVARTTNFSIGLGLTPLEWETAPADLDGWWSAGSPATLTCPAGKGGWYYVYANAGINGAPGGGGSQAGLMIVRNGDLTKEVAFSNQPLDGDAGNDPYFSCGALVAVNDGDTLETWVFNQRGLPSQVPVQGEPGDGVPSMGAFRIADL